MTDERLKQFYPLNMLFGNLTERDRERWYDLMWDGRERYLKGESTEIYPCMFGDFYHQRKKYLCTHEYIIGLTGGP